MSNKELAYKLIDSIPERQLPYVVGLLQDICLLNIPEVQPDKIDLQMIAEAEKENDGITISIEDLAKELNIELQD